MFGKRKEQPKSEHPSTYEGSPIPVQGSGEGIHSFGPNEDLRPYLPSFRMNQFLTSEELAAKREFVRRRLEHGATYSDYSELFCFDGTLGEMAEKLGMLPISEDRGPRSNPSIICKDYR